MPLLHYKYGGSTAARTIACTGWHDEAAKLPEGDGGGSIFAQTGTALHSVMEGILEGEIDDIGGQVMGREFEGVEMTEEHEPLIVDALRAWDELCQELKIVDYLAEQTYEQTPEIGGTADIIGWNDELVVIADWKFGQGIQVSPINSKQGLFYAMVTEDEMPALFKQPNGKWKVIVIAIIQPMPSRDGHETLQLWKTSHASLELFREAHHKALNGKKTLVAGSHCTFCPAEAVCPVKTGAAHAAKLLDPTSVVTLKESLDLAFMLEPWIKSVKALAHEQLELGTAVEGYKVVSKRATRKWTDEAGMLKKLKNRKLKIGEVTKPPVILSPAQIEGVLKKKKIDSAFIGDYINAVSGGTVLVTEDDPRETTLSAKALTEALSRL